MGPRYGLGYELRKPGVRYRNKIRWWARVRGVELGSCSRDEGLLVSRLQDITADSQCVDRGSVRIRGVGHISILVYGAPLAEFVAHRVSRTRAIQRRETIWNLSAYGLTFSRVGRRSPSRDRESAWQKSPRPLLGRADGAQVRDRRDREHNSQIALVVRSERRPIARGQQSPNILGWLRRLFARRMVWKREPIGCVVLTTVFQEAPQRLFALPLGRSLLGLPRLLSRAVLRLRPACRDRGGSQCGTGHSLN